MPLKKIFRWFLGIGGALVLLGLIVIVSAVFSNPLALLLLDFRGLPTDAKLITNFRAHRPEFEQLRTMMQQDAVLTRVAVDRVEPEDYRQQGISEERIQEYRMLFRKLGLKLGVSAGSNRAERVDLLAAGEGLGISGSGKSYVWRTTPPLKAPDAGHAERTADDLDALVDRGQKRAQDENGHVQIGRAYRPIEGCWYLLYED